jgi:predicted nucleotidyltransferase
MQPIVETHRSELARLCRQFHVRWLEAFGSATRDDFDPSQSDLDLLVEFEPDTTLKALHQYFGLKEALEALLGRPVDLVMDSAVKNPYIRKGIEDSREPVYAA